MSDDQKKFRDELAEVIHQMDGVVRAGLLGNGDIGVELDNGESLFVEIQPA